ncbi:MAG: hypothetical protein ACSHX8_14655 [Opitutaceae bacterium]
MKISDKNILLDKLSISYNRTNYLKILCEEEGLLDQALKLERRRSRLKLEIDALLRDLYQDWIGDAKSLKGNIDGSNKKLKEAIKDIEKKIKIAQNIVKAVGYIDDVIKVATDLVP